MKCIPSDVIFSSPSNGCIIPGLGFPTEKRLILWEKLYFLSDINAEMCMWPLGKCSDFPDVTWKFPGTFLIIKLPKIRHASEG